MVPRFRENEVKKLRFPAYCRQENATFSPHIHRTWEPYFSPPLYVSRWRRKQRERQVCGSNLPWPHPTTSPSSRSSPPPWLAGFGSCKNALPLIKIDKLPCGKEAGRERGHCRGTAPTRVRKVGKRRERVFKFPFPSRRIFRLGRSSR